MKPPAAQMVEDDVSETLVSMLWRPLRRDQTVTLVEAPSRRSDRSGAEMLDQAEAWAGELVGRGVGIETRVGVVASTTFGFMTSCFAAWRAGATVVPLPPRTRRLSRTGWEDTVRARVEAARVSVMIGDSEDLPSGAEVTAFSPQELGSGPSLGVVLPEPSADNIGLIQFSSGSTAAPKGIVFSHRTLVRRLRRVKNVDRSRRHDLRITPLHFGGLGSSITQWIVWGRDLTLIPPQLFMERPLTWLEEISAGATHSSAPNFAYSLATRELMKGDIGSIDLSGWESAGCAFGEAADVGTIEAFIEAAHPYGFRASSLSATYALTEGAVVAASPANSGLRIESLDPGALSEGRAVTSKEAGSLRVISSGVPLSDNEVKVIGSDGSELPDRSVGEFYVRSPFVMDGYLDDPAGTDSVFSDGWLKTGDLGFIAEGDLFVTGRSKDVIIVHGRNYHATDIEQMAASAVGGDVRCAAFSVRDGSSEVVVVAVEMDDRGDTAIEEVRRRIQRAVWRGSGLAVKDVVVLGKGEIPATDSGKLKRSELRSRYEDKDL